MVAETAFKVDDMTEGFTFQWHMLIYPLVVLGYFELLRWLDRHWANRKPLSDEEWLSRHARLLDISEYEIFHRATTEWNVASSQVDDDFKAYLQNGVMPHYVRDYIRKLRASERSHPL
jgi:hypothetical protein